MSLTDSLQEQLGYLRPDIEKLVGGPVNIGRDARYSAYVPLITITPKVVSTKEIDAIAYVRLAEFPGCCAIAILHNLCSRVKGLGSLILAAAEQVSYENRYTKIIGTFRPQDTNINRLARKYGWAQVMPTFMSVRTGNNIEMWEKMLTKEVAGRCAGGTQTTA